ncbi:Glucose-methanol-choline oxidoreductase family protein [Prunus dulcis]|uniref:Glucose-methanol-choline oxidoreductase family protein n=1 Tax=Prunus dulcis TaxID=3755 RepID=A0A4Y1R3Q6_PRUDU|nr:Glucose-methanol-choline oxidoreductase family protein [Prunus dulcis]
MGKKTKKPGKGKEKAAKAEEKRARRETRSSHLRMTSMPFWIWSSYDSLRVIDGSTFYHTPGANPQATVMMLGRRSVIRKETSKERVEESHMLGKSAFKARIRRRGI